MTGCSFINFSTGAGDDRASFTAENIGHEEAGGFAAAGGGDEAEVFEGVFEGEAVVGVKNESGVFG